MATNNKLCIKLYNIDKPCTRSDGSKNMLYQRVKQRKSVFYCFAPVKSIS